MARTSYTLTTDEIEEIFRRWLNDAAKAPTKTYGPSAKGNAECFIRYAKQLPVTE